MFMVYLLEHIKKILTELYHTPPSLKHLLLKLQANIKEVNTEKCHRVVKNVKAKTFNATKDEDKKSNIGFIPDNVQNAKLPP